MPAAVSGSRILALLLVVALLAACAGAPSPTPGSSSVTSPTPTAGASPAIGEVVPAPGSDSAIYAPNPSAIVVAIDPGHGGCLDWGVPNPWDNTRDKAEKADTLAIGLALRDLLEAQGITVVMTRADDSALAGDDYPDLGCSGPAWRDVDGNGEVGFEETGRTRTRDELQARIDLANLVRADVLVSIHINSMTQDGVAYEIAATQTFYDDETPWGESASGEAGRAIQAAVVDRMASVADWDRQDRATQAVAYYIISRQWQDGDTCEVPGDTWCKPHRALQLPGVLSEVGSMSLEAEAELLATDAGRHAAAQGIFDGLATWLGARQLAVRYDADVPGGAAASVPEAAGGAGPPYWASVLPADVAASGRLRLTLTNTGQEAWPANLDLAVGWEQSDAPYLASAPADLSGAGTRVPALEPGESVQVEVPIAVPAGPRSIAWITLLGADGAYTELGSPALQLATTSP